MAIIALKAWFLEKYEPVKELEKRTHDLRLSKNSLLKSGLRADFLNDSEEVKKSAWFQRYLEGEAVEFYIEGSGGYVISNIDLISHEIYFTKQAVSALQDPTIFLSYQIEYSAASEVLREGLQQALETLNKRSRLPISLVESYRSKENPLRLNRQMLLNIRKSLLFIADSTPITSISQEDSNQLIPSPNVCVEIGYAIQTKRSEQILLAHMQRDLEGQLPFDLPSLQTLQFKDSKELNKILPKTIETQLQRYSLFS
ncbi:hypothetical protein C7Y66_10140 [Chroococcidiopsis sp. CCALA 051]|uniref:hypothetical protein n=1 Tax=Chroococcidiopsis sp. CCALA 051 TaxID=869949 RepID=UPI000D0D3AD1|nr:hypothetical protein [Chroococcidiopsis sp. CCALA 051]MBE9020105.1 hypothetical protein [Chroococcidiopsidales cyanobacterium LEGE 13417]PSM49255.1 hypothetical protein C7Y66_10140 [Chroococcidiopsis sp. CCALA 051]